MRLLPTTTVTEHYLIVFNAKNENTYATEVEARKRYVELVGYSSVESITLKRIIKLETQLF